MRLNRMLASVAAAATFAGVTPANAARPYVVIEDDGTVANFMFDDNDTEGKKEEAFVAQLIALYQKRVPGELPEILSLWTTFDFAGTPHPTNFFGVSNDTHGIGYGTLFEDWGKDGVFRKGPAPLRSILLHNNVLRMKERAKRYFMPEEGLEPYLFLLEISHTWGATVKLDGPNPNVLLGRPPHWSFWLDAGGSPEGGNVWKDNGDGSFTAQPLRSFPMKYSMLDLYVMGLAPASEVPPFGVLEDVVAPDDALDRMRNKKVYEDTFPWMGEKPITVRARRREVRIEEVIAKNGPRSPAYPSAPKSWTLGIGLIVRPSDSGAEVQKAREEMDRFASTCAPAFQEATGGRGTLRVITSSPDDAPPSASVSPPPSTRSVTHGCAHGCRASGSPARGASWTLLLGAVAALFAGRRKSKREVA